MIDRAHFGNTGHNSSRTLFGAASFATVGQAEADSIMELLLEFKINHIDTAASYGEAEKRLGPWIAPHRDKFFLATKTEERSYEGAMKSIENSRRLLDTDVIDLLQMHVLVDEKGWQTAMSPGGALEAFIEAKEKGWVRFLGVTGHGVQAADFHMRSLEQYPFDSVLLPWNYPMSLNEQYKASFEKLAEICREKKIALQTIKSSCRRPWPEGIKTRDTWYQPIEEQEDINKAVAYILSNPQFFLNTVGDIHVLPRVLKAADDFCSGKLKTPNLPEMQEMSKRLDMTPLFH
ncbi:aldo/keto reductase [Oceanispirochaeta sp.]|jgi:aryl-alcohol dehydrogenase-like predicted oxidoreductase|uniref:aldo/keto reductase n=1 Tax=Oceanispirochaeta sp. TaxID=2035350 RepID=UPI00260E9C57|nr:aldo/keto reductase [Oceanispirochaeta sp.]MDA3957523.1 aldo/keto reductase [Oceanispirochaeta sp.]